jgi:hypothetical protein
MENSDVASVKDCWIRNSPTNIQGETAQYGSSESGIQCTVTADYVKNAKKQLAT